MTSRRDFTKIISIGTLGTLGIGMYSCNRNNEKQQSMAIWPSDKVNLAFVGINGRGLNNIQALQDQNIVALCDVDWGEDTQKVFKALPKANRYKDFRVMLEKEKNNIDGVVISTPDHTHAIIAMMAIRMGKHVFCEKPLARSVHESREITKAANEYGVQTQMGNQGHSTDTIRQFYEHIKAGTVGKITEVHAWCDRPEGGNIVSFPHGITRPKGEYKVPKQLEWDLWLGPAPYRSYHPIYHPRKWRGFKDFGCGALGDFGCHILDPAFWALDLGSPGKVVASNTDVIHNKEYDTFPTASIVTYEFPERDNKPPVKLIWYDGGLLPLNDERFKDVKFGNNGGLVVGEKGIIYHDSHGANNFRILLFNKDTEIITPPELIERSKGHHADWIEAIKTGKPASADFNYGGPLTETVLLGVIATLYRNTSLEWDNENMKFSNFDDPDNLIQPNFRQGWSL